MAGLVQHKAGNKHGCPDNCLEKAMICREFAHAGLHAP
jgi:hypothetical protein